MFPILKVKAGFPSPAEPYLENPLDLNEKLIQNRSATFFVEVDGDSMEGDAIFHQDLLIVDRSLTPQNNQIVVAVLDNNFTIKRFHKEKNQIQLLAGNPNFKAIQISPEMDFYIWGVVTYVIHKVR